MPNWQQLCRASDLEVTDSSVRVRFPNGRSQVVRVDEREDGYRLRSTAMGAAAVDTLLSEGGEDAEKHLALRLLQQNRSAPLVGYKWTPGNRILAESFVPAAGLDQEMLRTHLLAVARAADRLELRLTGQDRN